MRARTPAWPRPHHELAGTRAAGLDVMAPPTGLHPSQPRGATPARVRSSNHRGAAGSPTRLMNSRLMTPQLTICGNWNVAQSTAMDCAERNCSQSNTSLSDASLSNASLSNTSLSNARLSYASLSNASLFNASLPNASLSNASPSKLSRHIMNIRIHERMNIAPSLHICTGVYIHA